jgi:hypothetical protein
MGNPTRTKDKILSQDPLMNQPVIDPSFLARQTSHLTTLLIWLITGTGPPFLRKFSLAEYLNLPPLRAVALYANFYKTHLTMLAEILASTKKAEPIGEALSRLKQNLDKYVGESNRVANRVLHEFPSSPWDLVKQGPLIMVMAPILIENPTFVQQWNEFVACYSSLMRSGLEVTEVLAQQGRDIERETPKKIDEITDRIDQMDKNTAYARLLEGTLRKQLNFIVLRLEPTGDIVQAHRYANRANQFLHKAYDKRPQPLG